jgi:hypothetical protein
MRMHLLVLVAAAGNAAAQCSAGFSGGSTPIPDPGTYTYVIGCGGAPGTTVGSVALGLRIFHPRQGDLVIRLRHDASGTVATLMNRPGSEDGQSNEGYTAANLGGLNWFRFDDSAPGPYAVPPVGAYPRPGVDNITGLFRPTQDPLSIFSGLTINSSWTVTITDEAAGLAGAVSGVILYVERAEPWSCYPNCDHSFTTPFLNINDYVCFQNKFASGDTYANCDNSTTPPVLSVNDFICFISAYVAGCSAP